MSSSFFDQSFSPRRENSVHGRRLRARRQAKPAVDRLESRALLTSTDINHLTSAFGLKGGTISLSSVATDTVGDIYVTGTFKGTVNFDPTGTTGTQFKETTTDPTISEIFVAEYGTDGTPIFVDHEAVDTVNPNSPGQDLSNAIAVDSNGLIYVTGSFSDTVDFSGGTGKRQLLSPLVPDSQFPDAFFLVLNPDGTFADDRAIGPDTAGTKNQAAGYAIAVDPADDTVVIGGDFQGNILDTDGATLESPGLDLTSQAENADAFIAAYYVNTTSGDTSLSYSFAQDLTNGGDTSIVNAVTFDGAGDINAAGSYRTDNTSTTSAFQTANLDFSNPNDNKERMSSVTGENAAFITQVDATTGNWVNSDTFESTGGARIDALAADSVGNVYATGTFAGTADIGNKNQQLTSRGGNTDGFIVEYDQGLNAEFVNRFGNVDEATGVALESDGTLHVVGGFSGPANYGDVNSASVLTPESDNKNLYVLDIDGSTGELLNSYAIGGDSGDTNVNGVAFSDGSDTSDGTTALTIVGSYQGETNFVVNTPAPLTGSGLNAFFAQASFTPATPPTPTFSMLSAPAITYGTATATFSGVIAAGALIPSGNVTIGLPDGTFVNAAINSTTGVFFSIFTTSTLSAGHSPYTVFFSYAASATAAAASATTTLTVNKATPTFFFVPPGDYATVSPASLFGMILYTRDGAPILDTDPPLSAGQHTLTAYFFPVDTTDYNTAVISTTFNVPPASTSTPTSTPTPTPAPAPVLSAIALKEKVGKKTKLFAHITSSLGGQPLNIQLPYQAPTYTRIVVASTGRTIVASARKGRRSVMQIVYSV